MLAMRFGKGEKGWMFSGNELPTSKLSSLKHPKRRNEVYTKQAPRTKNTENLWRNHGEVNKEFPKSDSIKNPRAFTRFKYTGSLQWLFWFSKREQWRIDTFSHRQAAPSEDNFKARQIQCDSTKRNLLLDFSLISFVRSWTKLTIKQPSASQVHIHTFNSTLSTCHEDTCWTCSKHRRTRGNSTSETKLELNDIALIWHKHKRGKHKDTIRKNTTVSSQINTQALVMSAWNLVHKATRELAQLPLGQKLDSQSSPSVLYCGQNNRAQIDLCHFTLSPVRPKGEHRDPKQWARWTRIKAMTFHLAKKTEDGGRSLINQPTTAATRTQGYSITIEEYINEANHHHHRHQSINDWPCRRRSHRSRTQVLSIVLPRERTNESHFSSKHHPCHLDGMISCVRFHSNGM